MNRRPKEQGVFVPVSKEDLAEVLYDKSTTRDKTWYKITEMMKDPNFSIPQMKEYQSDLWNWVVKTCQTYWNNRKY